MTTWTRSTMGAALSALCILAGCNEGSTAPGIDGGGEDARVSSMDGAPPSDGGPSGVDAGPPMSCETPGAVEAVSCGRCGSVERFCTAEREWVYGVCEDEHGCEPGALDTIECGLCGTRAARCTASCEWEPTGECSGEGTCAPGTRTRSAAGCGAGETREVLCGPSCGFEPIGACESDECTTPGAIESIACGMCGTQDRFCTSARVWEYGTCSGEGECAPGTSEMAACGMCGTETRRCTATCTWSSGACGGEGVCSPGETRRTGTGCPDGQTRALRCTDACALVEVEGCTETPVTCSPACASGETCGSDGRCRCGAGPSCGAGDRCVSGTCSPDPSCPEASTYGCRLAPVQCGCTSAQTCDVDRAARVRICRPPGPVAEAQPCSDSTTCGAGLACYGGICHRWCETDAHCGSTPGGRCILERRDLDGNPLPFPAMLCSIGCNPITSAGCAAADACQILTATTMGTMAATDCRAVTSFPFPGCFDDTFCPRGEACVGSTCQRYCRIGVAGDCGLGSTCTALPGAPVIGGVAYGSCG